MSEMILAQRLYSWLHVNLRLYWTQPTTLFQSSKSVLIVAFKSIHKW